MATNNYNRALVRPANIEPVATPAAAPVPPRPPVDPNQPFRYAPNQIAPAPGSLSTAADAITNFVRRGISQVRFFATGASSNPQIGASAQSQAATLVSPVQVQAALATATAQAIGFQGAWNSTAAYVPGATVELNGTIYLCIAANSNITPPNATYWTQVSNASFLGAWSSTTAYVIGNVVSVGSALYIAIANSTNQNPTSTTGYWQELTSTSIYEGTWSSSANYTVGQSVSYQGNFYIAIATNTNQTPTPTGSTYWVLLGTSNTLIGNWSNTTAYITGNEVIGSDGNIYQALQNSTNQNPVGNPTYWQLMGPDNLDAVADGTSFIRTAQNSGSALSIPNSNFTAGTAGWVASGGTIAASTQSPVTNGNSLQHTCSVQYQAAQCTTQFKVAPGDQIYVSLQQKSDGTYFAYAQIVVCDGAGNVLTYDQLSPECGTSTSWTTSSGTFTMPANADHIILQPLIRGDATGGSHSAYVTNIHMTRLASLDNEIQDGLVYARGTFVLNSLTLDNANFEASSSLPVPGWGATGDGTPPTLSYETGSPYSGSQSLKVVGNDASHYGWAYTLKKYSVTVGQQVSASCYAKSDGTCTARLQIRCLNAGGGYTGEIDSAGSTSTSWNLQTATGTIPANTVYVVIALQVNPGSGFTAYYDNVSFSTVLDNVVDGSTYSRTLSTHVNGGVAYNFKGAWSSVTSYVIGDEVDYGSNYWIAVAANSNSAPSSTNANWQLVGLGNVVTARASSTTGISGTVLNPTNAYDGLLTDYTEVDGSSATVTYTGFPSIVFPGIQKLTLKISAAMLGGFANSGTLSYRIGSGGLTTIANVNTTAQTTYSVDVSSCLNPALIQVKCDAGSGAGDALLVYEIWIEETSF